MAFVNTSQSAKSKIDVQSLMTSLPSWTHPEVQYAESDWSLLRDAFDGEREVKGKGTEYLPKPSGMDDSEYTLYKDNATYFNMTARTIGALVGTIFKRSPIISNLPDKLKKKISKVTKDNQSLRIFSAQLAREVIHMGRYGVLVDLPTDGGDPYMVGYVAEAILDWEISEIDGRDVLTEVVLLEVDHEDRADQNRRTFKPKYRVLRLIDSEYQVHIYKTVSSSSGADVNLDGEADKVYIPTNRGNTIDYIPFTFFGPESTTPKLERSPVLDIARMNISHYRSYAHLEHGRFYTGLPIYYVSKANGESEGSYKIGPSVVWEVAQGEKAGLLEFNGQGLKFLENAIASKEAHIATLGGRLIGVDTRSVSESDNQVSMKNRNEHALLLNITSVLDTGITTVLRWWARWLDVSETVAEEITIEFSKEFLLKEAAAREFRAIQSMYKDGLLPVEVFYDYMLRADVIPDWIVLEEFKALLDNMDSFPNNPNVQAMKDGFPDRKTELSLEENESDRKSAEDIAAEKADTAKSIAAATERAKITAEKSRAKVAEAAARKAEAMPNLNPLDPNQPPVKPVIEK